MLEDDKTNLIREREQTMISRRLFLGTVAAGSVLTGRRLQAAEYVTVLTGGTSGVYYPLGVALAKIYGDTIEGARTSAQATKASVENLNLLQQGKGEIAFTLGDSLIDAWNGREEAGFKQKLDRLRGIAAIYPNYIQVVASKESGIASAAAGMSYDDLDKVEYLPFAESVELMKNRQLDATLQSAGLGVASIRDLATSVPITLVPIGADLVGQIGKPFQAVTVPAGTYEGQDTEVATAAVPNYLVSHSEVSDELGYQMTARLFDHLDQLAAAHAAAKTISLENALNGMPVPLHPGAERFFGEKGMKL
jgi:TRAP-type uncharacterized transport system substrate-binding protein